MRSKARDIAKADAAILAKLLVTVTCVVWLFFPLETFNGWGGLRGHLLYGFSHANVFHCAANLLCMWLIRFRIRWVACYTLSVLCSYIPCAVWDWGSISFVAEPTCGLSGLLICAVGMEWGRYGMLLKMMRHVGLPLVVFGLVPHVNMLLHLWCLMAGWMYGFFYLPRRSLGLREKCRGGASACRENKQNDESHLEARRTRNRKGQKQKKIKKQKKTRTERE